MAGAVVIGAGPGIGRSVALRFAREGLPVALTADAGDEAGLRRALDTAAAELGQPDVVVYNAGVIRADVPGELSMVGLLATLAVNVGGALAAAAHVAPSMAERGGGTFVITGGMPEPVAAYTSLSLGKAGVRAAAALLAQQYGPAGVHVATVTVAGAVAPGTAFDPDDIAEHYWRLHTQPAGAWDTQYVYGG